MSAWIRTAIQWLRHRKLSPMMLTSAVLVLVFGGLTLLIHDKTFIQWKPTVVNWLFAAAFLASQFFGEQPLIQRMMGTQLSLDRGAWTRLNAMWIVFFAVMGAINLYVAYHFDEATWVNFKLFGILGLTLVFVVVQGFWLASKMATEASK